MLIGRERAERGEQRAERKRGEGRVTAGEGAGQGPCPQAAAASLQYQPVLLSDSQDGG